MTFLVDTSVWSLALRRNSHSTIAEVEALRAALSQGSDIATTGIVLLELLQRAVPSKAQDHIRDAFNSLSFVEPDRQDYEAAAHLSNTCRRNGVQLPTVDALIAQLTIRHELILLTTDKDFTHAAEYIPLRIYDAAASTT
ncbi:MAG: type II toxin-antitoxin system VapC family toxin [Ancrocorticia sp.]|uniref:type II toxin-antitoxin system VapC family toxin n=1 Tax=Ancrocorticia sp. TaxID=2593684 RepID=UPI003F91F141